MKKIVVLILMTLLISSCSLFNKEDKELEVDETEVSDQVENNSGDTDDKSVDVDVKGDTEDKNDIKEIIGDEVMDDVDTTKSDDEIVKEFEDELDSLFDLLEGDE